MDVFISKDHKIRIKFCAEITLYWIKSEIRSPKFEFSKPVPGKFRNSKHPKYDLPPAKPHTVLVLANPLD
ncbi:MAG: hypothetical protein AMK69_19375 [Nitrospira bacterium SG8_3]|nr:MAG: hypothetical protein AMK69_19375 [Nitrospira bacterium SG8_3]